MVTGTYSFAQRVAQVIPNDVWAARAFDTEAPQTIMGRRLAAIAMLSSLPNYSVVYQVGGPFVDTNVVRICNLLKRPIVLHWIGTDVLQAGRASQQSIVKQCANPLVRNWVDASWLATELAHLGIEAETVPLCALRPSAPPLMPAGPLKVLLYLPSKRFQFYGGPMLMDVAKALPEVHFFVVGSEGCPSEAPANVEFLGWQPDMRRVYERCHVLVRIPQHDGLSFMVAESLNLGRYVIWNYPFTGSFLAQSRTEVILQLQRLKGQLERHRLPINSTGHEFIVKHHDMAAVGRRLRDGFERALEAVNPARRLSVVVCGQPSFASRSANALKSVGWNAEFINTGAAKSKFQGRSNLLRVMSAVPFVDVVYQIGGPKVNPQLLKLCGIFRKPLILHWIGSDVLKAALGEFNGKSDRFLKHWAVAPWLVEELKTVGIRAAYIPPNEVEQTSPLPLPSGRLTAAVYLPAERAGAHESAGGSYDFYGGRIVEEAARLLPDIDFLVVGGTKKARSPAKNMTFLGWCSDMRSLYRRSHVLLRITQHDGLSNMVTEALSFGRYVIWSYSFPGVLTARSIDELIKHLTDLRDLHERGALVINTVGKAHVDKLFSADDIRHQISQNLGATFREAYIA